MQALYTLILTLLLFTTLPVYSWSKNNTVVKYNTPQPPKKRTGTVHMTTGTGFYVNPNYIITNEHVVQGCQEIVTRGGVEPTSVELIATNKEHDLALLKSYRQPVTTALLSGNKEVLEKAPITVIGYPKERSKTGNYLIRKGKMELEAQHFYQEHIPSRVLFSNIVQKGNSGGPLLDGNGNVIGIILGIVSFYSIFTDEPDNPPTKLERYGVATNTDTLRAFLDKHHVSYRTDNTYYHFEDHWIEKKAKQFIVNIWCIQEELTKKVEANKNSSTN